MYTKPQYPFLYLSTPLTVSFYNLVHFPECHSLHHLLSHNLDIVFEDTVGRAEEKFEQYDCVKYAACNAYLEADGTVTSDSGSVSTNDPNFNTNKQWHMDITDVPKAWNRFSKSDVGELYPI